MAKRCWNKKKEAVKKTAIEVIGEKESNLRMNGLAKKYYNCLSKEGELEYKEQISSAFFRW